MSISCCEINETWDDEYTKRKKYAQQNKLNINQVVIIDSEPKKLSSLFHKKYDVDTVFELVKKIYGDHPYIRQKDILFNYLLYKEVVFESIEKEENEEEEEEDDFKLKMYIRENLYNILDLKIFSEQNDDSRNENNIYNEYVLWKKELNVDYEIDVKIMDRTYEILDDINYDKILNTEPLITGTTIVYLPERKDGGITLASDGVSFFNDALISEQIPFIKYIDNNGISYYKTLISEKANQKKMEIKSPNVKNFLFFRMCVLRKGLERDIPDEYLVIFSYDLTKNKLKAKLSIDEKTFTIEEVKLVLERNFPSLNFDSVEKNDIKALIDFYNFKDENHNSVSNINMYHHVISKILRTGNELAINHQKINEYGVPGLYMFIDETEKLMIDTKSLRINLMSLTSNSTLGQQLQKDTSLKDISKALFSVINLKSSEEKNIFLQGGDETEEYILPRDLDFIRLKIKRCNNEETMNNIIRMFKIFIVIYEDNYKRLVENMKILINDVLKEASISNFSDFLMKLEKENVKKTV